MDLIEYTRKSAKGYGITNILDNFFMDNHHIFAGKGTANDVLNTVLSLPLGLPKEGDILFAQSDKECDLSGFPKIFKNGEWIKYTNSEAVVIPMMEDCEFCDNGKRTYPPVYIDGDLYQDGEVAECDECGGRGKVKVGGKE